MAGGSREQDSDDLVAEEADEAMLGPIGGESGSQVGRKSLTGMTCSLKTLIDDDVLQPGAGVLHMSLLVGPSSPLKLDSDVPLISGQVVCRGFAGEWCHSLGGDEADVFDTQCLGQLLSPVS